MRILQFRLTLCSLFFFTTTFSQAPQSFDLQNLVKNNGIEVFNRNLTLINEPSHAGIRLSKDLGEGIAWLKGVEFSNGTIEFDLRGDISHQMFHCP